jgi:drug/metabolite transporter (DMT)-like permease
LLYFLALRYLPLAETAAITFAAPVITVALCGPVLGERVSRLSAMAAVVGFVGVVAVIQPFSGHFGLAALLPLGAAFASGLYSILTRALGGRDSAATTWFYTSVVGVVAMSIGAPFGWVVPGGTIDLLLLMLLGILGGAGHFLLIKAYQRTAASVLAPLAYLQLVWITLIGLIVFHTLPNTVGLAGIALIAGGGIVVAVHERAAGPRTPEAMFPRPQ